MVWPMVHNPRIEFLGAFYHAGARREGVILQVAWLILTWRASDEHSCFVRVPRARRIARPPAVWQF